MKSVDGMGAPVLPARWQDSEASMRCGKGVLHNTGSFVDAGVAV